MPEYGPSEHLLLAKGITAERLGDDGRPVCVLDGIDLALDEGSLVDIVGPSGAGKTTLLLALARLLPGARGWMSLDDRSEIYLAEEWRALVALVPQRPSMFLGTVADNLLLPHTFRIRKHGRNAYLSESGPPSTGDLRHALDSVGLTDVDLDRDASRLSVGQAARVAFLRTLLTRPRVLLLDEPDASLDDASAALVTEATRRFVADGGAAVRVRHLRSDDLADRRYRLEAGRLTEEAL